MFSLLRMAAGASLLGMRLRLRDRAYYMTSGSSELHWLFAEQIGMLGAA